MRLVIQRVSHAAISIDGREKNRMGEGLVVLFAAKDDDLYHADDALIEKLAAKTANLRIFSDDDDKMNLSAMDLCRSVMVVSNFTLFADTKKGNRPSFIAAAKPPFAEEIYNKYVEALRKYNWDAFLTGSFGAMMEVEIVNDGPVTIIIDTMEWGV